MSSNYKQSPLNTLNSNSLIPKNFQILFSTLQATYNTLSTFDFHQSVTIYILIITKQIQENQILQKYFFLINLFIFIPFKKKICTMQKANH